MTLPVTRPINGERALPTDVVTPHEHEATPEDLRRVIEKRNKLSADIREVWNEPTLDAVARVLKARET